MPSRASLELRAGAVNVVAANFPNDSVLEQRVIAAEKAVVTGSTSTTIAPAAQSVASESGGQATT